MKYHIRLAVSLIMLVLLVSASAQTNRLLGHSAVAMAPTLPVKVTQACTGDITDIDDCPKTGCGELGDAELNTAKNNEEVPASGAIQDMTIAEIKALRQPRNWTTGRTRSSLKPTGEGKAVRVMGFLLRVKAEGGESCNCGLTQRAQTDVHFALVANSDDVERESITAEITPRVRKHQGHDPKWRFGTANDIEGDFVRITGWLMLDTKHLPQARRLPGERINRGLERATNWEVHPIIKIETCSRSISACKAGRGWEAF